MSRSSQRHLTIRLGLVALPVLVLGSALFAQLPQPAPAPAAASGQTPNMTGKGGFVDSADLRASRIRFEAGARTHWHTHSAGQVIVAEEGVGMYQMQGSPAKKFVPGEAVYLKANVAHWHGAAPDTGVTQATMYNGTIVWGAPVTDDEYTGKKKR